jgi:hypothetical protein
MNKLHYLNKDTLKITAEDIAEFLEGKNARVAKSIKYAYGERVTPSDTYRKADRNEYLFVSSMRWTPYRTGSYGGFILFNPRTCKLISATNITRLPN